MNKGKKGIHVIFFNSLKNVAILGLFLNTYWVLSVVFNLGTEGLLDPLFNNRVETSAAYNIILNFFTFNWFYCLHMLFFFMVETSKYLHATCGLGYFYTFLFGWLFNLDLLGSFWYNHSYMDVKTFWLGGVLFFKSITFSSVKGLMSVLCPVTMLKFFNPLNEGYVNFHFMFKKQDFFSNVTVYILETNNFFF